MTAAALNVSVRKEARALLPLWAGCMLGILATGAWGDRPLFPFAVLLYGFGSIALGAQAMGHEYANRTLHLLLTHPIDRRALLLIKLAVLAPLLAVLGALSLSTVVPSVYTATDGREVPFRVGFLVLLSSLCLAPTLTMICRNGTAGVVFTVGIAGALQVASQMVGYGREAQVYSYSMLMVSALGSIIGWRHFTRLEAIEGGGRDWQLPGFASISATAGVLAAPSHNPVAKLIAKELRLQQLTFAVVGMWLVSIFALLARRSFDLSSASTTVVPITILYAATLPLLIGGLASAEERRMGTLEWQQLMPMPVRTQFAVKAAVALALALLLSLGLPALSRWLVAEGISPKAWPYMAPGIVLATSAGLYVSSLNSSGIRAVLMAMPSILISAVIVRWISVWIAIWLVRPFMGMPEWRLPILPVLTAAALGLSALLLRFAYRNHGSTERPITHIRRQCGWIAGAILLELIVLFVTGVL